jgi:hypothetical protein
MEKDKKIRKTLIDMLQQEHAHAGFKNSTKDIPFKYLGIQPENLPYSIWQLTEHIRITQWDILEFSRNPKHKSPKWPDEYWPVNKEPSDKDEWEKTLNTIEKDKKEMIDLISDSTNDLYEPFPHGDGQNLFREALLIIDHTSYHTGQIIILRRLLNIWD